MTRAEHANGGLAQGWRRLTSWVFTHFCGEANRIVHVIFGERCCGYCKRSPWA